MRSLTRFFLFIFFFAAYPLSVSASHLMGGEITWICQGNGQFVFQMKLYRDCNGVQGPAAASIDVFNNPSLSSIAMNLVSQTDISPQCNVTGPQITCANAQAQPGWPASATPVPGAVEEFVYQSAPITISGTPPAGGWVFAYTNCCRNMSVTNINNGAGSLGFTLRAKMYAYNNQNTNPCYDNSPEFLESPKTIICTGYPFTYNHNAVDKELDSLSYSWAEPLDEYLNPPPAAFVVGTNPPTIPFVAGFAFNNPMPGPALNPGNVPATINPITGEISYTSFTQGNFVTCIKVEAWKCGQLVAEIYRDIQVVLLPCGNNSPPAVTPPFNANTSFNLTIYAGQLVNFNFSAVDNDTLSNGAPQTMTLTATGQEFGAGFTNAAAGCINPPCATLNAPPPVSAIGNLNTTFNWQTACNHVYYTNQCAQQSNVYDFILRTTDDFCPAPAQTIATISITVLAQPLVNSPKVHCVAVQLNGDVTLTWEQPPDTGGTFNSYHIYTSANVNGPFIHLDSIFNYNQLTYTHVGANANAGPVFYYVQTRSGCGGLIFSPPADTMSSIYLQVNNSNNQAALLNWNNISIPPPTSQYPWFRIYREYPTGIWTLIDSTQSLNYVDSIQVCNNQVNYRIEIGDSLGCVSVSNVDGDLFLDNVIPNIPLLDSVSVNAGNTATIGWNASTSHDVIGYVVYQYINGIWTAIDTLWGINNTGYINGISNAGQQSESYVIAALDSCGNVSTFSLVHSTIFLNRSLDICTSSANLWWNNYQNMPGGGGGYNIFVNDNGGPFTLAGSTAAGDTTFTIAGLVPAHTYCCYVQAFNNPTTITATSQEICFFANFLTEPVFNYLRTATVAGTNSVNVIGYVDVNADVVSYNFYRADTIIGPYNFIGSVAANPPNSMVVFTDNQAETGKKSYFYRMSAVDSCGTDTMISNYGRTIFLQAISNDEITNTLYWNDYAQWPANVADYNIYRSIDGVWDPVPVNTVPFTNAGENIYTDDVQNYIQYIGKFSYQVEAMEAPGNPYGFADSSWSNIADVVQKPLVYVPNAFTPNNNGLNDIFMPSTGYVDIVDYNFSVFNRWGEKIFETNDRTAGWDGKYAGHRCEPDVYVWLLTFKTASGQYIDEKGIVTLLR
ncbi:MAG: gliding motility-associated C-terminal domain-containing protein [Bacteroidetes bacterium]|nr:gliding motility-associated C-terminal domain-containing protein [Bacteroidota bacterium]